MGQAGARRSRPVRRRRGSRWPAWSERRRGVRADGNARRPSPISIICERRSPLHETADELCAVAKDLKLAP